MGEHEQFQGRFSRRLPPLHHTWKLYHRSEKFQRKHPHFARLCGLV